MAKFFFTQVHNVESVVENGYPLGGSVVQTLVWMKALHELGHEVYLAKFEEDDRSLLPEFLWVNLVPIYHSGKFKKRLVWFFYRFPKIYFAVKQVKPDYLFTSIPNWKGLFLGLISRLLGIKHIIRVANDPEADFSIIPYFPKHHIMMVNAAYKMADLILVQNIFQYKILVKKFPKAKVRKLFNPIVLDNNYLKKKEKKEGYIAWLANFRYQKNLKLLHDIVLRFPKEYFKVAGVEKLPLDNETEVYLKKLENLQNVEFMGLVPRNRVLAFLHKSKFLLNTSRYEGFSNTFLESMVTGTPILTTSNVNPDGIIEDYDLGILFTNAEDLKNKLTALSEDEYLDKSKNAVAFVIGNHDHLTLGKQLLSFLNEDLNF
jgi:glycosyltransferase involved in cell wall biosynthesis